MNTRSATPHFSFQLPSMSYIDARWEEPNLRNASPDARDRNRRTQDGWLTRGARAIAATLRAWHEKHQAVLALQGMTDRELRDIGLARTDIARVFDPAGNGDLRSRGRAA